MIARFPSMLDKNGKYLASEIDLIERQYEGRLWFNCREESGEYLYRSLLDIPSKLYTIGYLFASMIGGCSW